MIKKLLVLSFLFCFIALQGQEINTVFGKNRVQYTDDFDTWFRYETDNFVTYWYGKSRNVALTAVQFAEYDFEEIQNILEHRINEKIELVVYGDLGELYQTNIGLDSKNPEEVDKLELIGTKLFVHFDGNHHNLRELIREGVAKVFMYSMLYGTSFQEIVQSTFMSDMPEWFKSGIVAYTKDEWNEEDDAQLRYYIQDKKRPIKNFRKLSRKQPDLAGKAFWYYLGKTYGHSSISNIIYLTRINRSVKAAFRYVMGEEFQDITKACFEFHKNRYEKDSQFWVEPKREKALVKNSNDAEYLNMKLSNDGKYLAYAQNKNGRIGIYYQNTQTGERKRLKRLGYSNSFRPTDRNYPVYFWSQNNELLGYIYEKNNILEIRIHNLENGEIFKNTINPIFDRIYAADFIDDRTLMINGNTNGFSDLYSYNLRTRIEKNITEDLWDDLDAEVTIINGIKGILFSSNRDQSNIYPQEIDTVLVDKSFDLYFLPWEGQDNIIRLSNTPGFDEFKAEVKGDKISYLTNRYGINSIVHREINNDFSLSKPIYHVQYLSNIKDKSCHGTDCYSSTMYRQRSMIMRDSLMMGQAQFTSFKTNELNEEALALLQAENESNLDVNNLTDIPDGWFFETIYDDPAPEILISENKELNGKGLKSNGVLALQANRVTASRLQFKIRDMDSYLDNEPLFTGLNSYAGDQLGYQQPPLGLLMKMKIGDSFEDYVFEGGVRLATNFSGYELFLTFEDRKNQWDHFYGVYYRRRSNRRIDQFEILERNRDNTYIANYQIKYPFDEFQSVRLGGTFRSDRDYTLITNEQTFNSPIVNTQRVGLRAEYVYDNSSQRSINIYNGIRSKVFVEGMNRFRLQLNNPLVFEPSNGYLGVVGVDTRYYLPIFEKSVLAARISVGTSLGSEKILYYIGGVERSLINSFDNSTGIPDENFAFENIAPQLRGFERNIRNGTSYVVSTVELRVPVFRHLFSDQIKYDFLREFQLVAFFDSGTAWHGRSPYSPENPINSAQFMNGEIIKINVQYFRDPLVLGYGGGFRTSIFGYFIKVDVAQGIETKARLPWTAHVSIGTDF